MTVLAKKVFTSSNPATVRLLCPPPRGPFSIQENAVGGLSYKVKKAVNPLYGKKGMGVINNPKRQLTTPFTTEQPSAHEILNHPTS